MITIVRTPWIDDDGSGTTGTVLNNAVKTDLYNQIDAALAQAAQLNGGNSFSGNQVVNGQFNVSGGNLTVAGYIRTGQGLIQAYDTAYHSLNLDGNDFQFSTQGTVQMRISQTGAVMIATTAPVGVGRLSVCADGAAQQCISLQNVGGGDSMYFVYCANNGAALIGGIGQNGHTAVTFNTSSDARLKDDAGRASDLSSLRGIVVHDFTWKADGIRDRGVFAQEARDLFPRAVIEGTDETTENGDLARPWMTDYSKFVPDLIVGWQQHDAEIAELRAALAAAKG